MILYAIFIAICILTIFIICYVVPYLYENISLLRDVKKDIQFLKDIIKDISYAVKNFNNIIKINEQNTPEIKECGSEETEQFEKELIMELNKRYKEKEEYKIDYNSL
jgi:uncharacterized protein YoxC